MTLTPYQIVVPVLSLIALAYVWRKRAIGWG